MVFFSDQPEAFPAADNVHIAVLGFFHLRHEFVVLYALFGLIGIQRLLIVQEVIRKLTRYPQDVGLSIACRNDLFLELRVKEFKVLDRNAQHFIQLVVGQHFVDGDRIYFVVEHPRAHGPEVVFGIVIHHVIHRDKGRYIAPGFPGQEGPNRPVIIRAAGPAQCPVYIAGSRVVGRECQ